MTREHTQFAGLVAMTILAGAILWLIGYSFHTMMAKVTPQGEVPVADAGLFTALLLSFRECTAVIKTIWESADRSDMTAALSNSMPTQKPNPPVDTKESDA